MASRSDAYNSGRFVQLPSTLQAVRLTEKAGRVGFDWQNSEQVLDKLDEEINELKESLKNKNQKEIAHELGDVLFAACNLARHLQMDPEEVNREALQRFRARFKMMEKLSAERGQKFKELPFPEKEALWVEAKKLLG